MLMAADARLDLLDDEGFTAAVMAKKWGQGECLAIIVAGQEAKELKVCVADKKDKKKRSRML